MERQDESDDELFGGASRRDGAVEPGKSALIATFPPKSRNERRIMIPMWALVMLCVRLHFGVDADVL